MGAIAAAGYCVFTEGFWSVQWRWIPNGGQTLLGALDWGPGLVSAVPVWATSKICRLFFFYSSPFQNVLVTMDESWRNANKCTKECQPGITSNVFVCVCCRERASRDSSQAAFLFQVLLENLDNQFSRFAQEKDSFLLQRNFRRYKQNFQVSVLLLPILSFPPWTSEAFENAKQAKRKLKKPKSCLIDDNMTQVSALWA